MAARTRPIGFRLVIWLVGGLLVANLLGLLLFALTGNVIAGLVIFGLASIAVGWRIRHWSWVAVIAAPPGAILTVLAFAYLSGPVEDDLGFGPFFVLASALGSAVALIAGTLGVALGLHESSVRSGKTSPFAHFKRPLWRTLLIALLVILVALGIARTLFSDELSDLTHFITEVEITFVGDS